LPRKVGNFVCHIPAILVYQLQLRYNVYSLTLYEELNPTIRLKIEEMLDKAKQ